MLRAVAECPHPVVARVQGSALGGGAGRVAAADIAIAADTARFAFTEARLGLIPATVAPFVIEKIGAGRARALFLTAERFDAVQARTAGLVHRVVPEEALDTAVEETVASLLAGGPQAHARIKELVREAGRRDAGSLDEYTSALLARVRAGDEGQEGVRAFLEKRPPRWSPDVR
jgi:methylglutaconyl-CoA hydratase